MWQSIGQRKADDVSHRGAAGALFCLYFVVFRWNAVTAKYGRLDLYFWLVAMTLAGTFLGYLADVAIWAVQYAIWLKSN